MSVTIPDPETGSYIPPAELRVQRKLTQEFIRADKKEIVLVRSTKVPNGTGGYKLTDPDPLPAQDGRIIPSNRQLNEREKPDGEWVQPSHTLMMEWDSDLQRFDTFTDDGNEYLVLYVQEKHAYQKKGELIRVRAAT